MLKFVNIAHFAKILLMRHAYNGHFYLYEDPGPNPPTKACSQWNRLTDRSPAIQAKQAEFQLAHIEPEAVQYEAH